MGKGYWERCYDMKKEVVAKIREALGNEIVDIEDQDMVVVAVERHNGEPVEGRVVKVSCYGFWMDFDSCHEYPLMDMILEDLCCLLDYLIEIRQ